MTLKTLYTNYIYCTSYISKHSQIGVHLASIFDTLRQYIFIYMYKKHSLILYTDNVLQCFKEDQMSTCGSLKLKALKLSTVVWLSQVASRQIV